MFVLTLRYTAPLDRVDELLPAHVAWLDEQYAAGRFLASGRQVPRTGGVILAALPDRPAAEAVAASDPFTTGGVASYDIVEFVASRAADGLEALVDTPTA